MPTPTRTPLGPALELPPGLQSNHQEIAARAFDLYERRGRTDGADLEDWLEAERQLAEERATQLAGT